MIIIVSDQHIGDRNFKYFEFLKFLMTIPYGTTIILNGDFEDLYKISQPKAVKDFSLVYTALKKFNVIRLRGNHDDIFSLPREYKFWISNEKNVIVYHGDRFDVLTKVPWYTKLASKVENVLDTIFRCNFRRVLYYLSFGIVAYFANKVNYSALEEYHDYVIVVIGHTHFAKIIRRDDRFLINCGEWLHDCTYVKIDDEGSVSLNYWISKKEVKII